MAENRRSCASCGTSNEEDARFCEGCGGTLARMCSTCGVEASATARFCRGCGASLDGRKAPQDASAAGPVRKTVTVMFADLVGSTTFEEKVDAETARDVIGRYHDLLRSIAQRHRAGVTKYIGDGFMAVWGVPEIGPDDAAHAVDAAVELQERFVELGAQVAESHSTELALRVAVNTGEVVVGAGDADLVGDALNVGARLEAECPRGHVVVGEETWRATRGRYDYESLGQVQVKGRTAPVAVYEWLSRQTETSDAAPFVGRGDEVRRLQAVLDVAISAREARLVTVIGDPGVGKSRLAAEFTAVHGDARVVEARCVLEGTVALAPIVEVLRARDLETDVPASIPERDRLLRDLNGLMSGIAGSVEENFWALRRFVEVLALDQPLLLVIDDIQWADALLVDFIEHLVEWVQEVPVLVLALARPELRETRPDLVTVSRWVSEAVHLGGLDASATAELAAKVLGAARLPDDLLRRLPSSTGGNPLFVRELVGMLAHDGVLVEQATGWRLTIDVDAITIPPTIHALLASRLERLDSPERRLLEIASVVGSDFSLGAVRALTGVTDSGVDLSLNRLRRLELAQPSGAYIGDEPVWRFHHVLIRDVAYRRLLKSERADLHERLAEWVEAGGPGGAFDADEMVARHLEAAHTYRLELGVADEHTGGLALRAARHYAASARRALDRDELVSAGMQAARGAVLATADAALHAELLLIGCEAFLSAGDVAAGAPLVDELDRIADEALSPWATCYRCQFIVYTDPERLLDVDARLQGAIDEFGRRRDQAGLAKAHRVRAGARSRLGRIGDCEADLFEALIAARQSGDHRQITAALGAAPSAALWGPSPVPKAGGRCLDVVRMQRMTTAAPSLEATSLRCLAVLELLRGRPDKARTMLADARQVVADLGLRHGLMETELFAGIIESMEGDPVAAEPHFRTALEGLDALGAGADAGQAAALLAKSVLAQGRLDEADTYAAESERLAGRNLKTAIAWRAVRAEISAAQGRHDAAAAMAREAVAVAAATDLVLDHAEACIALSRVLAAAGDAHGATSARMNAEQLYAAKEVAASVGSTVAQIRSSPPPDPPLTASPSSRLAVKNRATDIGYALIEEMQARDLDAAAALYSDRVRQDDHRRLSGDPIEGRDEARAALERLTGQYSDFETRMLAVRGGRLALSHNRWSDEAGNETTDLIVVEVDDVGQIIYQGRFDEDFEAAYRVLDQRFYAGDGSAFAESGVVQSDYMIALNQRDLGRVYDELSDPEIRIENRSRSVVAASVGAADARANIEDLNSRVASMRSWHSVVKWVSPACCVARYEREAAGADGEQFAWTGLTVNEVRGGRITSMCLFEADGEEAAFAYAEERIRATTSRLTVANRSWDVTQAIISAHNAHDVDAIMACCSEQLVFDDRRRLSGAPIGSPTEFRIAFQRVLEQYNHFEAKALAVRGDDLNLHWCRWSDDAGNETAYLQVCEVDDDDLLRSAGRFDEDDFEGAYRELERRYCTGSGAVFAEGERTTTEWILALNHKDFDRMFGELSSPDFRVVNKSRSAFPDRSAAEYRATMEGLAEMVASSRLWNSAACWLSPSCGVFRSEREAFGEDGQRFAWSWLIVADVRDGRAAGMCEFEVDDEASAFAYAEERIRATAGRLATANTASDTVLAAYRALPAGDVDRMVAAYADKFVSEDRRRLGGGPVDDAASLRTAMATLVQQYSRFDWRVLAVRGDRLALIRSLCSDDAGFETVHLHVHEIGDDGRIVYEGRFDEDDFESAFRELDRRYYSDEGAAFAENGIPASLGAIALNRGDFDEFFGDLSSPDLRVENQTRSAFPERSAVDLRASFGELNSMTASTRTWMSAVCWLSPTVSVTRLERDAFGEDGTHYAWTRVIVTQHRDGRFAAMREFEPEDDASAFAYAEELVRAATRRLAVTNRASETVDAGVRKIRANEGGSVASLYSEQFVYDDRRRLKGEPIVGRVALQRAIERIGEQYPNVEWRTLAVRGERLALDRSRWTDDAGNETAYLHVFEIDDDGRIAYDGRFDGDDLNGAYRELERRFYAEEGAAFAETGASVTELVIAYNEGDFDRFLNETTSPGIRFENRSRSVFPDRSAPEFRASIEELSSMVSSARAWYSAIDWLSPNCFVSRFEREAVGQDGEQYAWTRLYVNEIRDGRATLSCQFDLEDEDAAFAYAEEHVRATEGRLAVTNRASGTVEALTVAMNAADLDAALGCYTDSFVYDDRRRISGDPIRGLGELRVAATRILQQYDRFDTHVLAVRGERLQMGTGRWSNGSGYESVYLSVHEIDDDGRFVYEGRFDENDFDDAYREMEKRYYSGQGAAYAEAGRVETEVSIALNQGDLDRMFSELVDPEMRFKIQSRSAFPERSATELRASLEELSSWVASMRSWHSAMCWLSPTCCVARNEREAVGRDGAHYAWTRLYVTEMRDGRSVASCEFEIDGEDAAFAYAEERARTTASRLTLTNRATGSTHAMMTALSDHDIDDAFTHIADAYVYDDRRKISGDPIEGTAQLRVAVERILEQYNHFEGRTLAIRGQRLELFWSRWWDDSDNETTHLHVFEVGDDKRIAYEGRFDGDDFDSAYRELDRRYYAGEGIAFAETSNLSTEWVTAVNRRDLDRAFTEFSVPDASFENRSHIAFPDPAVSDPAESFKNLNVSVASTTTWVSAICQLSPRWVVVRIEREAVGADGERYAWTWLDVTEIRGGRCASTCLFDLDDEEAAFAYAEERVRAATSRLPITNRASDIAEALLTAVRAHNVDEVATYYSDALVYDDRRRLGGVPFSDVRTAMKHVLEQYTQFERRTLAVRGERTYLGWTRWTNDAGYETSYLGVHEVGDDGRFVYQGRFDEDDFDGAYRELNERYYAGEGAAFAEAGAIETDYSIAYNQRDFDRMIDELSSPDFRLENRSRSAFPDRSAAEFRASSEELGSMVSTVRMWSSAVYCVSPTWCVTRNEREAVGKDGEHFTWTRIIVAGIRDGRVASMCVFEADDEEGAFAYAEEKARKENSRLSSTNLASRTWEAARQVLQVRDTEAAVALYADPFVFDDRRRLGGNPLEDIRTANERVLSQYNHFEARSLAVRGERLHLGWTRWSNESGFETSYLIVYEVNDSGRVIYEGRFDEDNFEDAYRELERRYYAGEGAAFAEAGATITEYLIAMDRGDTDQLFGQLTAPGLRLENRSRVPFGDRSIDEFRATEKDLHALVDSTRSWSSAMSWVSPTVVVGRFEREAVGPDGEQYAWSGIYVDGVCDRRLESVRLFETDDEEAAFAYAEERVRAASSRLSLTNLASRTFEAGRQALLARDIDAACDLYTEPFVFDDRRRLSGNPLADLRTAQELIVTQYSHFEGRTLAVRGEHLHLGWTRWSNDSGFETSYLMVHEVNVNGRFIYEGRFDEDNFEDAYRELTRRWCAGEGASAADGATLAAEYLIALNRGDFDRVFNELVDPGIRVENRTRTGFPTRSAAELRTSHEELTAMVSSMRSWQPVECFLSPTVSVCRHEREAVGRDGEKFEWTRLVVAEAVAGRCTHMCLFEVDDEAAAFAYAEERVRQAGNS